MIGRAPSGPSAAGLSLSPKRPLYAPRAVGACRWPRPARACQCRVHRPLTSTPKPQTLAPELHAPQQWELVDGPDLLELINERGGALGEDEAVGAGGGALPSCVFARGRAGVFVCMRVGVLPRAGGGCWFRWGQMRPSLGTRELTDRPKPSLRLASSPEPPAHTTRGRFPPPAGLLLRAGAARRGLHARVSLMVVVVGGWGGRSTRQLLAGLHASNLQKRAKQRRLRSWRLNPPHPARPPPRSNGYAHRDLKASDPRPRQPPFSSQIAQPACCVILSGACARAHRADTPPDATTHSHQLARSSTRQLENAVIQRATHTVKVIDFGLTKHIESARTIGIGTPGEARARAARLHGW